jgi:DNA-binding winged helix-turn-helix (wHTH) protein
MFKSRFQLPISTICTNDTSFQGHISGIPGKNCGCLFQPCLMEGFRTVVEEYRPSHRTTTYTHTSGDGKGDMDERRGLTIVLNGRVFDTAAEGLRDASGKEITLRAQSFAVLRYLALNADRIVTKDELMDAVWPDIAVTENSLVQCIHEIRRALGDESQSVLKTVARRGYRLAIQDTSTLTGKEPSSTARLGEQFTQSVGWKHPFLYATALLLVATFGVYFWQPSLDRKFVAPPSIAVLPFNYENCV